MRQLSRARRSPCHRRCDGSPYFAVNVSDQHDVQSHMFRPTITDMQDKYCGNCYDIHFSRSQYKCNHKRRGAAEGRATSSVVAAKGRHLQSKYTKGAACGHRHNKGGAAFGRAASFMVSFLLTLHKINIVAVTTIIVLHVSHGRSEPV